LVANCKNTINNGVSLKLGDAMPDAVDMLRNYRELLRERQLAMAGKLVDNPGGADQIAVAVNNAAGFATLQSAIDTADDVIAELGG